MYMFWLDYFNNLKPISGSWPDNDHHNKNIDEASKLSSLLQVKTNLNKERKTCIFKVVLLEGLPLPIDLWEMILLPCRMFLFKF